jgi:hypothetical protein
MNREHEGEGEREKIIGRKGGGRRKKTQFESQGIYFLVF